VQQIFIGDVQGCADELEELLARAEREFGSAFEVTWVGDLINRGPRSLDCLRIAREYQERSRGRLVLGNHEIALLCVYFGLRDLQPLDSVAEILDAPDADEWVDWLRAQPVCIAGELGASPYLVVHAAVHPDWDRASALAQAREVEDRLLGETRSLLAAPAADPQGDALGRFTRCRSIDGTGWSSGLPKAAKDAWHAQWAERGHSYGVVYGHWALQRLHVAPGLRGLDTGCVHHGRGEDGLLTAWLPRDGDDEFAVPDARFWQVRAKRRYYAAP